jgi:fluoride exporter
MSTITLIAVASGGAIGSVARYVVGIYAERLFGVAFPWGTLGINVTGSFLIGTFAESFALRGDPGRATRAFLMVGICGGYTTFSTFSLDVASLVAREQNLYAAAYIAASVILSIAGLYAALSIVRAIAP